MGAPLRILVTGAAGYIGSILTPRLLAEGHTVTALDSFRFAQSTLLDCCQEPGFDVVRGDAREEALLRDLLPRHDVIIPLAALVGAPVCDADRVAARTTNLDAVRLICRLAGKSQWILFPTTNSGYGIGQAGTFCTEESPLRPISLYGVTKVEAEEAVLERENSVSFRLATVFGLSPRMRLDLLVNDFVFRAVHDRALVVFEGDFKRNYIHVRDVAKVFGHSLDRFAEMRGRPFNVGLDDANLSKLELCAEIKKQVPEFVFFEAAVGEDPDKRDYIVSNARVAATGFVPDWSLARGIVELVKGYRILPRSAFANR